jgi:uncharacterized Zn finger protein
MMERYTEMKCIECGNEKTEVTKTIDKGNITIRYRKCQSCGSINKTIETGSQTLLHVRYYAKQLEKISDDLNIILNDDNQKSKFEVSTLKNLKLKTRWEKQSWR